MPIATNYQQYEVLTEPYTVYNKQYVDINCGGTVKPVRFYNDEEWALMHPQQVKDRLGFTSDYIYLLNCSDETTFQQWLEQNAKYNKVFGWYVNGDTQITLPEGVTNTQLKWEDISYENEVLPTAEIEMIVAKKRKHFQLQNVRYSTEDIGKKITDLVVCVGTFPIQTRYGPSTIYSFIANDNQGYEWITNSVQNIEIGATYFLKGVVKTVQPSRVRLIRCSVNSFQ